MTTPVPPAEAPEPRRYHHGDLRRALLDAAIDSITEDGSASFSLRDLARRNFEGLVPPLGAARA